MNEEHLNYLQNLNPFVQGPVGRNIQNFGNQVQEIEFIPDHLDQPITRQNIIELVNGNHSNLLVTVAILGWGGMQFNHARILFNNWNHLDPLITSLRNSDYENRQHAFNAFMEARAMGHLPRLGIAFFTKLICFLGQNLNAYIMDQWTGKSINLLWDEPFIQLTGNWVNNNNNAEIYDAFCNNLEQLAEELNCTPLEAEERIFSRGGINPGAWRSYLRENYPW